MSAGISGSMSSVTPDVRTSLRASAEALRDATLDVVWRQWRAVGGQASTKATARAIVDPEALILMTASLEEYEPRLTDILHDWMVLNCDLLSVQRVKNLARAYPKATRDRLHSLAQVAVVEAKDLRWRALAAASLKGRSQTGAIARENRNRAVRVRVSNPAALLLRLRLGLGVGAKADVLAFLLGVSGQWSTIREIAAATGYTVTALRRATDDMAAARLIHARSSGPIEYRIDQSAWGALLEFGEEPPPWRSWNERYVFVTAFLVWVRQAEAKSVSEYALGVSGRALFEQHRDAFDRDLLAVWNDQPSETGGLDFVKKAASAMADWLVRTA